LYPKRPPFLLGSAAFLLALLVTLGLGAPARPASSSPVASAAKNGKRAFGTPRNFKISRRTTTTISMRWMRARGGAKPLRYKVFLNRRLRARTRRKHYTLRGLRCGTRYRIWVEARDRKNRQSRRAKRWVRTPRCSSGAQRLTPPPAPPAPPAGGSTLPTGGASSAGPTPRPGSIPPGGGSGGAAAGLPARLPQSTGAIFHVATNGNDSGPGTEAAPWRTVQKALNTLGAGQTAYIHGGTYAQSLRLSRGGTASDPVTIRSAPGEIAILQPSGGSGVPLQLAGGAAYARFYGLVFEGAQGSSTTNIYALGNAHDIEISACEVRGSQRQGFFSENSVSRIHIIGCYFHDNGGSGPTQQDHNIYIQGSYNAVLGNVLNGARNGNGIQVYPQSDHIVVAGNTIVGSFREGVVLGSDGGTTSTDAVIVNNIVTSNRGGITTYWGGSTGSGNIVRNNLVWGNLSNALSGAGVTWQGNLSGDPMFVNPGGGDFHLRAGSPALGTADPAFVLPADIDGDVRPLGSGPDLGAYEG
jgi:hypothetical protein